jgi:hypothetical protein
MPQPAWPAMPRSFQSVRLYTPLYFPILQTRPLLPPTATPNSVGGSLSAQDHQSPYPPVPHGGLLPRHTSPI